MIAGDSQNPFWTGPQLKLATKDRRSPMNHTPKFESQAALFIGIALVFGSLLIPIAANIPIWLSLAGGIAVAFPFLAYAVKVDQPAEKKPFLPSAESFRSGMKVGFWNVAMVLTFLLPFTLLVTGFLLIPNGDNWPIVIERVVVVAVFLGTFLWWTSRCRVSFDKWFRGRASDALVDEFTKTKPPEPFSWKTFFWNETWLLLASALGLAIFFGLIDFNAIKVNLDGPRRLRGLVSILVWCRGNPNTLATSSLIAAIGCLVAFGYQTVNAMKQSRA